MSSNYESLYLRFLAIPNYELNILLSVPLLFSCFFPPVDINFCRPPIGVSHLPTRLVLGRYFVDGYFLCLD